MEMMYADAVTFTDRHQLSWAKSCLAAWQRSFLRFNVLAVVLAIIEKDEGENLSFYIGFYPLQNEFYYK